MTSVVAKMRSKPSRRGAVAMTVASLGIVMAHANGCSTILGLHDPEPDDASAAGANDTSVREDTALGDDVANPLEGGSTSSDGASNADGEAVPDGSTDGGAAPDGGGACRPNDSRCSPTTANAIENCDLQGQWGAATGCAYVCSDGGCGGECVPEAGGCGPGQTPQTCGGDGRWVASAPCANVCVSGQCTGACVPGTRQCSDLTPEACGDGGAWVDETACPYVCADGGCTGECVPGSSQCPSDTQVQSCSAAGTLNPPTTCTYACVNRACGGQCVPGSVQCASNSSNQICDTTGEWGSASACIATSPICMNGNCPFHAGLDSSGGTTDTLYVSFIYAIRFVAAAQTKAYRLGMFGMAAGTSVRMAIYSESSGLVPDMLLGSTANIAATAGTIEAPLSAPLTLLAGAHYWIAAIASANTSIAFTTGGAGYAANNATVMWNTLPAPFPAGASISTNETPDFYVVLENY